MNGQGQNGQTQSYLLANVLVFRLKHLSLKWGENRIFPKEDVRRMGAGGAKENTDFVSFGNSGVRPCTQRLWPTSVLTLPASSTPGTLCSETQL